MRAYLVVLAISASVLLAVSAYAECTKCKDENTKWAMCYSQGPCARDSTMSACVLQENGDGTLYCDPVRSVPGPECNGRDESCTGGGSGPGGGGDGDGGGGGCLTEPGTVCPPQCSACLQNIDPWP